MNCLNQRGAVSLTLLTLLPFLLATASFIAAAAYLLKSHTGAVHECRIRLMRAEENRLSKLHSLLRLNPQAQRLRLKREVAEQALKAAMVSGNPKAIAAAKLALEAVVAQQLVLATKQKSLLARASIETRLALSQLKTELRRKHEQDTSTFGGQTGKTFTTAEGTWKPLAVEARPPSSLTPDYITKSTFEKDQTIRVRWSSNPLHLLPDWLGFSSKDKSLALKAQCATTAEPKGSGLWRARLQADKP